MHMSESEWKKYRKKLQIIFQDPYSALNPNWNVKELIAEPLKTQGYTGKEIDKRIRELLKILNMNEEVMEKYPYEFEWLYGNKQGKVNSRSCGL